MTTPTRRLFFALWPDEGLREQLVAGRNRLFPLAGRPVDPAGLHVTAAFLGAVSTARVGQLAELAGPVPSLTIRFDRLAHWPKPRVLVADTTQPIWELRRVVDGLWQRLDRLGFPRETRPYRPHVTLMRDVTHVRNGLPWVTLEWPVTKLHLVESVSTPEGVAYRPIAGGDIAR